MLIEGGKIMKGGYQIIDIRKLNLTLSNTTHSITDAEILEQLRSLRAYIQKGHDFTKPLDNALKCIQIRYRDQKNGEKLEACQWANIETSNKSLTYEIKTKNLMIEIVFEEKTDEYDNKYYDIKTAKYLYNHNEIIEGNLTVGGDAKIFENIVDKDGHKRFIDGNIALKEGINLTLTYGKWSLSGSHLLIVLAGTITNGDVITSDTICEVGIPEWVLDKIYPTVSTIIENKTCIFYDATFGSQNTQVFLEKYSSPKKLSIYMNGFTVTNDRNFRLAFDLLIDNE